jgi:hypothetical protein
VIRKGLDVGAFKIDKARQAVVRCEWLVKGHIMSMRQEDVPCL